jgi:hypothetical protein
MARDVALHPRKAKLHSKRGEEAAMNNEELQRELAASMATAPVIVVSDDE